MIFGMIEIRAAAVARFDNQVGDIPRQFVLYGPDGAGGFDRVLTVHHDGRIERGPLYTTDEAAWRLVAQEFWRRATSDEA